MVEVNRDLIIAITLLNSEKSVLTFGQSAPMRCVIAHLAVIASNEAIYRRSCKDMDCHGAARLAMTRQWGHCDLAPALPSRPVIARNEAIHCGLGKGPWIATSLRDSQ
jgi:hypothetical protein